MKRLIGFVAGKQVGKTLASQYLCEHYGYTKLSFSDPLKHALQKIFGFSDEQLWGNEKEKIDKYWGISPRFALQFIGTDLFRNQIKEKIPHIGDNIWIMIMEKNIKQLLENGSSIVVDDIRFPNEAELISKLGGTLYRIVRPSITQTIDSHSSEQMNQLIDTDAVVNNNGDINDFYVKLDQLC